MSDFTTQLRWYAEQTVRDHGLYKEGMKPKEIITAFRPYLFDFDYPLDEHIPKETFETDFIRHFYMWEIGAETVALFKQFLEDWLNTNMDYYNHQIDAYYRVWDYWNNYNYHEDFNHAKNNLDTVGEGFGTAYGKAVKDVNQTFGNTAYNTAESDTTNVNSSGDERHHDITVDHSMDKYYEVPSKNITSISDHLNNAREIDATKENTGESDQKAESTTDFDSYIKNITAEDKLNDNIRNENGNSVTSRNREDKKQETINDGTTKLGRQGESIGNLISQYIEAINNVKKEIFEKMECLFMGVW